MSANFIALADVRMPREAASLRHARAAKTSAKFIRHTAEAQLQVNATKEDLARRVWEIYWLLNDAGVLASPHSTRTLLRDKFGFWTDVGVTRLEEVG